MQVVAAEQIPYTAEGLEAIVFTADGDMRQALNNLQATHSGFDMITDENVFKVCDQPHPAVVHELVAKVLEGDIEESHKLLRSLWNDGYSAADIITTLYKVVKNFDTEEYIKLEFIKDIGFTHMKIVNGLNTLLQLSGLLARLCLLKTKKN